jgi:hypothetical protein
MCTAPIKTPSRLVRRPLQPTHMWLCHHGEPCSGTAMSLPLLTTAPTSSACTTAACPTIRTTARTLSSTRRAVMSARQRERRHRAFGTRPHHSSARRPSRCGYGLVMPRPVRIGEPRGIIAAQPVSSRRRACTGSPLVYGSTMKPSSTNRSTARNNSVTSGSGVQRCRCGQNLDSRDLPVPMVMISSS